ncbi:tyrosine-type recombinase/integrase [Natrinema versiforme]|uniref:Integrase domain-containing protein SAM domain-containing protein n=1 Tax=Natrinema versiforme JCM 10478 TaxID=1227496 RepID=L9YAL3_9EURY|nr:site-specific integrase [Natrinema versiforme]ELY69953.1 integrase domain-containing protein SAM domain-containing protein [Natrinema versiforme JCM 10478]
MTTDELDKIDPESAYEMYLADREPNVSSSTLYAHRSRLGHFVRWCDENEIETIAELTGRDLHQYRLWRRDDGDLNRVSEKTQMDTLRVFIRWCEHIGFAANDLHLAVQSPSLEAGDNVRDVMLEADRADEVLNYLSKYEYASLAHVTLLLLWQCGLRIGAAHALDVDDYDPMELSLEVVHRPATDTPLKNKADGERHVAIAESTRAVLDDWVGEQRPAVTDGNGREPLLATVQGRSHKTHLRKLVYAWTRPCAVSGDCPHGRTIADCDAAGNTKEYSCPSSVPPHAIRRGAITHWLKAEWPMRAVSGRANVSQDVLEMHYDQRSEEEKMEQRRQFLDTI